MFIDLWDVMKFFGCLGGFFGLLFFVLDIKKIMLVYELYVLGVIFSNLFNEDF